MFTTLIVAGEFYASMTLPLDQAQRLQFHQQLRFISGRMASQCSGLAQYLLKFQCFLIYKGWSMLQYAAIFFVVAIIAAVFGFTGIAAGAASIAKILFLIFIVIAVVSLIVGLMKR